RGRQLRGDQLQTGTHGVDLRHVFDPEVPYACPFVRDGLDQSQALQLAKRLPDRGLAHLEFGGDTAFDDPFAGFPPAGQQTLDQYLPDLLPQRLTGQLRGVVRQSWEVDHPGPFCFGASRTREGHSAQGRTSSLKGATYAPVGRTAGLG